MLVHEEYRKRIQEQRFESPEIAELLKEREKLLKENPELRETQKEIDNLLSGTIDPEQRLEIVFMLMSEKLLELQSACTELVNLVDHTTGKL